MKVIKQTKETITLELTPVELELFRGGMTKESSYRRKAWKQVTPRFPEELMYHAIMNDSANQMKVDSHKAISQYQAWGIIKA